MAERLRKQLVNALKAVFKPNSKEAKQCDYSAFEVNVKRLAEKWLNSLFTDVLLPNLCLRVWDVVLLYGFEYLIKFGLTLLSLKEKEIIQNIKKQVKMLGVGASVDALIIAGNSVFKQVFSKIGKIKIEKMLKKALTKPSYQALHKSNFYIEAYSYEKKNDYRLVRIRQTKQIIKQHDLDGVSLKKIENFLNGFEKNLISTSEFCSFCVKYTDLSMSIALNIFCTIDESGQDKLEKPYLKLCLSILSPMPLKQKLEKFHGFTSLTISLENFLDKIQQVENFFDPNSKIFNSENFELTNKLKEDIGTSIRVSAIPEILTTHGLFDSLCQMIEVIDMNYDRNFELRIAEIDLSGSFSNIHSPSGSITSVISEGNILQEIESKLLQMYEEKKKTEEFHDFKLEKSQTIKKEDKKNRRISTALIDDDEVEISTKFSDPIQATKKLIEIDSQFVNKKANARNCSRLCSNSCVVN